MSNNKAYSLKHLLSKDKYIIPIYQRNYAWGKAEISQLIQDIQQFFESNSDKSYYIGSLVCFKRENGDYELIDGQQRHTTISLINAVLKSKNIDGAVGSPNLKFDSRKNIQRFLEELYSGSDFETFIETSNISGSQSFKDAIGFIREEFNEEIFDVSNFADNFYNKVKFFRVEVPQDTDLNHYFEIMNNRGEQLEKHEILKALLMDEIEDKSEQQVFAAIWDACSDMSEYVWFNFNAENRKALFVNGILTKCNFDGIKENITINSDDEDTTLGSILNDKSYELSKDFSQEDVKAKEKYKSVIDFPNFLMQVLKIQCETVLLDDKNLLKAFNKNEVDSKGFIFNLLQCRTIFDKYIIKQDLSDADEDKQNWSIRMPNNQSDDVVRTYENDSDELTKLQTMLYYSNPANTNNNWVHQIIKERYFDDDASIYSGKVFSNIVKPRFDNKSLHYPQITAYNLYYIDFLLWKRYKESVQGDNKLFEKGSLEDKISKNKDLFNTFRFRSLTSKEHLLPQSKATETEKGVLNSLGNLCLISSSQNSSANDRHPQYKKELFKNDSSSLKRLIMFESFKNDKWGTEQIQKHEEEIQALITKYFENI